MNYLMSEADHFIPIGLPPLLNQNCWRAPIKPSWFLGVSLCHGRVNSASLPRREQALKEPGDVFFTDMLQRNPGLGPCNDGYIFVNRMTWFISFYSMTLTKHINHTWCAPRSLRSQSFTNERATKAQPLRRQKLGQIPLVTVINFSFTDSSIHLD